MASERDLDGVRLAALDEVDRAERAFKAVIWAAGLVEATLLGTFLLLMDFGQRLHWLILVGAGLVYITLSVGLLALGAKGRVNTLQILKAIELANGRRS